jgi:hypothetical protein
MKKFTKEGRILSREKKRTSQSARAFFKVVRQKELYQQRSYRPEIEERRRKG